MDCGGPLTAVASNGFIEATASFVPGLAVNALITDVAMVPRPSDVFAVVTPAHPVPGEVCVRARLGAARPTTWCAAGRRLLSVTNLASAYPVWGPLTLVRWSPRAPATDFAYPSPCPASCRHVSGVPLT